MRDIFKTITQTMCEIIRWIDTPCISGAMVGFFQDSVGGEIPHIWIWVVDYVLFHAEEGFFRFVFAVPHGAEFSERFFDGAIAMDTFKSRVLLAILATSTSVNLLSCMLAYSFANVPEQ